MRTFWKMAAVLTALSAGGCVQSYGGGYGGGYAGVAYGDDAYGYCDAYGCPADYWDQPVYYGSIYYDDAWVDGPFYYRNGNGGRQYWVHGGWHDDTWRGPRPDRYRNVRTGPALGMNWYRTNHVYRRGGHGQGGHSQGSYNQGGNHGSSGAVTPNPGRGDYHRGGNGYGQGQQGHDGNHRGGNSANSGRAYPPGSPANVPYADRGHMSAKDRRAAARDEGLSAGGVRPRGYDDNGKRNP